MTPIKTLLVGTLPALVTSSLAAAPAPSTTQPAAQPTRQNNTQIAVQDQNRQLRGLIDLVSGSIRPSTWHIIQYPGVPLVGPQTPAPPFSNTNDNYGGTIGGLRY